LTRAPRDRDPAGRPLSARPRDALGRPLPYGSPAAMQELDPALLEGAPGALLAHAQQLLDDDRPFQAHELLEAGWKRAPESERPLWRALAQLAVGVTHSQRGNPSGAKALYARAARELQAWDARTAPHNIDVEGLAEAARTLAKTQEIQEIQLIRRRG
jgi:predicted metal-dependent hydrolase